jgi:uncharacterized phosphosugar-binding protein
MAAIDADALCEGYLASVTALMGEILRDERDVLDRAADRVAGQIAADRLVHVYGPGGHSNLAAQEIFFRAGGLMHVSAILDEGTLLSNGALRSMAVERTPGYGRIVVADRRLGEGDLLILVNAYGINAALIDAAIEAKARGVFLIGVSSRCHASRTAPEHPARHPTKQNLHDLVDIAVDTKVDIGDVAVTVPGFDSRIAAVAKLVERGVEPPVWRSGNAPGGDEANARFLHRFRERVRWL